MTVYAVLILGFIGALWWYNHQRQSRLDADPAQHELARLLVAASRQQGGKGPRDVSSLLDRIARSGADRRVRLTHAVMLVRSEAAPDLYQQVLDLSRRVT